MGLGGIAKKATGAASSVAKKASPEAVKQQMLDGIKAHLKDPLGLSGMLGGLLEKLGIDPAKLDPKSIIQNIKA